MFAEMRERLGSGHFGRNGTKMSASVHFLVVVAVQSSVCQTEFWRPHWIEHVTVTAKFTKDVLHLFSRFFCLKEGASSLFM